MSIFINLQNKHFQTVNPRACGMEECAPGHTWRGIRDYYLIHYVSSGCGIFRTENEEYKVKSGEIFIIKPNELCSYTADKKNPWTYKWTGFDGKYSEKLENAPSRVMRCGESFFDDMLKAESYGDMCEEYIAAKSMELLCNLFAIERVAPYAKIAKHTVDANYMMNISVLSIAKQVGINRNYLSRLFRHDYGITLQQYIIKRRMQEAKSFLLRGYNVSEVSALVGYKDSFVFSRAYKNYFSVSPSEDKSSNKS